MNWPAELLRLVTGRAGERCEYCRMHQSLQGGTFHVEHVLPRSLGGPSTAENLALACPSCNLHKADRRGGVDPETGGPTRLFHPRLDRWAGHFSFDGFRLVGLTPAGRATVDALDLNHPRRLRIREAEAVFHLFPPPDSEPQE